MDKQVTPAAQVVWKGTIRAIKLRILQVAEDDCYVEEFGTQRWLPAEDELASEAYMIAFLETRKQLKDVAEFAVNGLPKT